MTQYRYINQEINIQISFEVIYYLKVERTTLFKDPKSSLKIRMGGHCILFSDL